jgi:hypothetical protein
VVEALEEELTEQIAVERQSGHQKSALTDPCRPKGHLWKAEELALKAAAAAFSAKGDEAGKDKALEVLEAAGNFTECRRAAVSLFKRGGGKGGGRRYSGLLRFFVGLNMRLV